MGIITTMTGMPTPFSRPLPCSAILLVLAIVLAMAPGCGRKAWPEPQVLNETFDFREAYADTEEGCLSVTAFFSGEFDNIDRVILELEETDLEGDCQGCPFHADRQVEFTRGMENFTLRGPKMLLAQCGLTPGQSYRWRILAYNVHEGLSPAVSRIGIITP